jgi:hypothetical protein
VHILFGISHSASFALAHLPQEFGQMLKNSLSIVPNEKLAIATSLLDWCGSCLRISLFLGGSQLCTWNAKFTASS